MHEACAIFLSAEITPPAFQFKKCQEDSAFIAPWRSADNWRISYRDGETTFGYILGRRQNYFQEESSASRLWAKFHTF